MKRKRGLHREDHAPAHRAGGTSGAATAPPRHSGRRILGVAALAVGLLGGAVLADWYWALPDSVTATYVGSQACAECHQSQYRSWLSSHHFYAMQPATEETVLGDFNDAELHYHGIVARMYKRDGQFWVRTEGPDGQLHDYPVKYTFGVEPLQQYLVEFEAPEDAGPNTVGRLQVLRECWDTRQKRWFYLPPPDVPEKLDPSDDLHWTGIGQRWNTMCAECHSTDVRKNFDPATGRYRTTFSEISVGCEACHGPGSVHIQLAKAYSLFWDRKRGYGFARLKGDSPDPQIETCAYCHSRRRVLDESQGAGQSFFDRCALELPSAQTYFADGQILDEVYEVGSFWQSRMYHQKIRCSDCHDPHTARLKHSGNAVCTSCHQHPAGRYDTPSHHHHRPGSPGAQCVNCHMPETVYMEVDGRRDHSLRVPRPDLSVRLGVPNACTACHLERVQVEPQKRAELGQYRDWVTAARRDPQLRQALQLVDQWAAQSVEQWYGDSPARRMRHYGEYLASAWENAPSAVPHVLELCRSKHYPAVIRAAGWAWLVSAADRQALAHARDALHDPHPLVRAAAVTLWEPFLPSPDDVRMLDASQRQALAEYVGQQFAPLWPMLSDPAKAVRTQAASILGRIPAALLVLVTDGQQRRQLQQAAEEWIHTLHVHNDRAGSHVALGVYYEAQGDDQRAEQAYRTALRVEPNTVGPRSNLAALLERRLHGLQQQWQQALIARNQAQAQSLAGPMADLQLQVTELRSQELELLARDARLAPDNPDVLYRYGLALYLNGRADEAAQVLERGAQLERRTSRFPLALALLYEKLQSVVQSAGTRPQTFGT
ncbi:MAG: cytochrome c [Pirellulaceae bacterium]|nr:MAG: cytochrome c [Pirellulaceae bacterium]